MATATLTEKGQVVIPAEIRARHGLTAGTQIEFVDDGNAIRLVVRRRITPSKPAAGYGLIAVTPAVGRATRRLSEFDAAAMLESRAKRR
jgi:AbrB family looped-hinge helix DNA binding protein